MSWMTKNDGLQDVVMSWMTENDGLQDVGSLVVPYNKDISAFRGSHMPRCHG